MVTLGALWMPILVSTVVVFVASAVMNMILPHHKNDFSPLPNEEKVMDHLREQGLEPGQYNFPHCDPSKMNDPDVKAKLDKGPVGLAIVMPNGPPNMGKSLGQWFVQCLVISVLAGYIASAVLASGTSYLAVFRIVGTAAILGYCGATPTESIWWGHSWSTTFKYMADGVVYALLTAGVFGWLWPAAG